MSSSLYKASARSIDSEVLREKFLQDLAALSGHVDLRLVYSACFKLFFHLAATSNVLTATNTLDDFALPKTISDFAQGYSKQAFPAMHTSAEMQVCTRRQIRNLPFKASRHAAYLSVAPA